MTAPRAFQCFHASVDSHMHLFKSSHI